MKRMLLWLAFGALASSGCNCGDEGGFGKVVPQIEVTPTSLMFGEVPIGATRRLQLNVRNAGNADLEISSVDAMSPFGAELINRTVHTGAEETIDVAFSPVNADPQSGMLVIASNDPDEPMVTIPLSGQGVQGAVTVRPAMIDFSNTSVGTTRSAEIFFSNVGIDPVESRIVTDGFPRPEHFALSGISSFSEGGPLGLPPRSEVQLVLSYLPIELGEDGGRLILELCGERCGVEVKVFASAALAVIHLEPPVVDFGTVGIGATKTETVLVVNGGQNGVDVTSIQTAGGAELMATATKPLPARIEGNSSLAINLEFTPASAAQFTGELIVRTNDPIVPEARVRVTGSGEGPLFVVQPETLAFGAQRQAGTYQRSLLLLNSGSAEVRVQSISVAGDRFGLADVPGLPARLGSGQSLVPHVTFSPMVVGEYSGTVTVETDDPAHPMVMVPVTGGLTDRLCELEANPLRVNFGLMPLGFSRDKSVTVRNAGTDTCVISTGAFRVPVDPAITTAPMSFPMFPMTLTPGQSATLPFNYTPTMMAESKANYVLTTDDPVFPERPISLLGSSEGYVDIFTIPDHVDFGSILPGCTAGMRTVQIYNAGTYDVQVDSIAMNVPSTEMRLTAPTTPFALRAGATEDFQVAYAAVDLGVDSGVVEIGVQELPYQIVVPLRGEGTMTPVAHDEFEQRENEAVDVLFVIDDSCSMSDEQGELAMNFRSFIRQADIRSIDFRIGITTTTIYPSPGALVGPVMSPSTSGLESEFARQANVGINGAGIEQGLDAMSGALQLAMAGVAPNNNLLRPDASFVVVIVSDEDDQSAAAEVVYLSSLRQAAPNGFLATVISGQGPGCGGGPGSINGAQPAPRYEEFVRLTQGISASICGTWSMTLNNLGNAAFGLKTRFVLSKEADVSRPIEVRVNGALQPAGSWTYDGSDHSIHFTNPPAENSTITVDYTPTC